MGLTNLLINTEPVHHAQSAGECEAIYNFRYHVYVDELNKTMDGVDEINCCIHDDEDDSPNAWHFYTGEQQNISGAIRFEVWPFKNIPAIVRDRYCFEGFPDIENYSIAECSRLIISPSFRGKLVFPAIAKAVYESCVKQNVGYIFSYCAPGLVKYYRRLGYRPYNTKLITTNDGLRVPIVLVTPDIKFLKSVRSPLLSTAKKLKLNKRFPQYDKKYYQEYFSDNLHSGVETDSTQVWEHLQNELVYTNIDNWAASLFDNLPDKEIKQLSKHGILVDVSEAQVVTREGLLDRELFIVLNGTFEIERSGTRIALLDKGQVFGELAFFLDSGRRTASVRALTEGRLIILRRKFLDDLLQSNPAFAARILKNLSRIMAELMEYNAAWVPTSAELEVLLSD